MQDDSRDAYMDLGGRATQDAKAEGGGSERPEQVLEQLSATQNALRLQGRRR